jgi:hypothetical protein
MNWKVRYRVNDLIAGEVSAPDKDEALRLAHARFGGPIIVQSALSAACEGTRRGRVPVFHQRPARRYGRYQTRRCAVCQASVRQPRNGRRQDFCPAHRDA